MIQEIIHSFKEGTHFIMFNSRILFLIVAVLCVSLFGQLYTEPFAEAETIIKVGAYDNYPKIFSDNHGGYKGLFPDLLQHIAQTENWKLEYVPGTWQQCLDRLSRNQIDIMVDVAYSPERDKQFDFNKEAVFINWGTVYSKYGKKFDSLLELNGATIAVMRESIHTYGPEGIKNLLKKFSIPCTYVEVNSYDEIFSLLDEGLVDAGVVNRLYGLSNSEQFHVRKTSIVFNPVQIKFAFPKNTPQSQKLINTIDAHLAKFKDDPNSFYYALLENYISGKELKNAVPASLDRGNHRLMLSDEEKQWIAGHPVIRFGFDTEFAPFEMVNEHGEYQGIAADYLKLISESTGLRFEVSHPRTWKEVVNAARQRQIDILPCVGKTLERLEFLSFTEPYTSFQRVLISRDDERFLAGLQDLSGLKLAVQKGSTHQGFLHDYSDLQYIQFDTLQETLTAVSTGKADVMVGNLASSTYWIRQLNLTNLKIAAPATTRPENLYIGVRSDWPLLVDILNKALAAISTGQRNAIMQRWVGLEFKPDLFSKQLWQWLFWGGIVAVLILGGTLVWSILLKREVSRRKAVAKQLRIRINYQGIIGAISSQLINLPTGSINEHINKALEKIAATVDADCAYVYHFSDSGFPVLAHFWSNAQNTDWRLPTGQGMEWRIQEIKQGLGITNALEIANDDTTAHRNDNQAMSIRHTKNFAFIDLPRKTGEVVTGIIGVSSPDQERSWTDLEVDLIAFLGQTITSAIIRLEADIARKQYADDLAQSNSRLEALDQLKSMFIASMSHELRTPLNSIIGFTGVILSGISGELNPTQKNQLERVYKSAKHLLDLIVDVIDISKIEAGRIDIFPEQFDLKELVEEAVSNVRSVIDTKPIELKLSVPDGVSLNSDRRRVLQCLINLLSNAGKYTEEGEIELEASVVQENIVIKVTDTGLGIAEEDMRKLFEPFERLDSYLKVKAGGTGLGLYLTRKIVRDLLGGDIFVESTLGKGSIFTLVVAKELPSESE